MDSKVVFLSKDEIDEEASNEAEPEKKVYYEYVTDTVAPEKNMSPGSVAEMMTWIRERYIEKNSAEPGFSVAQFKRKLRNENPAVETFAAEHPRFFDNLLSHSTTDRDLDVMRQMLKFRAAVNEGLMPESHAKALLNEILLKHNSRPDLRSTADRERMADERIERKVQEGSYLGFDPQSIPQLREQLQQMRK